MDDCIIGGIHHYNYTELVTLEELKEYIQTNQEAYELFTTLTCYTLSDYCDKRKSVDMIRFNYCPICGKKIDWKAIKKGGIKYD